jgi:steroid 5-alpha reductase family enzyme
LRLKSPHTFLPSYVGEVTLWAGLAIVATSSLAAFPSTSLLFSPCVAAISPLFEYVLLTKVSGVPPLEESAENKWGSTKEWQDYKDKVPVFFALPGKKI